MWKQLKAHQAAELAKIEAKKQEIANKLKGPKKERPDFNAGAWIKKAFYNTYLKYHFGQKYISLFEESQFLHYYQNSW